MHAYHNHSRTHQHILIKLPNYYKFTLIHIYNTNLGATYDAPTEILTEASGAAEGVVG